jgi:uncharacterized protein (DUF1697 family)
MPELKRCFEDAGFTNVRTVLSSGNVIFDARSSSHAALESKAEACMQAALGRTFYTVVRSTEFLQALLETDPYAAFALPAHAKRVVSFLRAQYGATLALPIESDGAQILSMVGREVFTAYVRSEKGPVFMTLLEKTFGTEITTRTLDTVKKCALA